MNPTNPDQPLNPLVAPSTNQPPTTPPQPVASGQTSIQNEVITTPTPQAQPSAISARMDSLLSEQTPTTNIYNQQSQTSQPMAGQQQSATPQSATPDVKPKKAWTLITAWIAFIIATLFFLALGPGSIIIAAITSPYAWLVSYWWVPSVYAILTFAAPVVFILAGISVFFTYKKFPLKMRTVLILISGIVVGLPITWLSLNGIIPMKIIIYAIIMGVISVAPIILLIVFKIRDKKKVASSSTITPKLTDGKTAKIVFIVSFVIVVIELGFCVLQLITPVSNLIAIHEQEKQAEQAINSAAESSGSKSSKNLAKMVYAVCYGEYDVVYQSADDTGLFECKENSEVFSVTDPHEGKSGYYDTASASFLGATYDETVAKYFPDTIYIYRNYLNADIYTDLILLVEADSESEVIDKYADAIYKYIKDVNSEYTEEVRVSIFYTDKLDTVKTTRDYILLSGAIGLYDWLPHGNGLGEYYFKADEAAALMEIGENPNLYSSQTRDAIKFHRHISAEIDNGKTITLEQLRTTLQSSFEEGL